MKDLVKDFFKDGDRESIEAAVCAAEEKTAGEIVPMAVSCSYGYPMADVVGATALALPLAILLTPVIGGFFWLGHWNMWVFLGVFTLLFILLHGIVKRMPSLKRLFVSRNEIEEEVEEAALTAFYREGLYRTRDETGVLIFISVFERRVRILADRGINEKVAPSTWDETVSHILTGIRGNRSGEAICEAVSEIGRILAEHFPVRPDDTDELKNLIVDTDSA